MKITLRAILAMCLVIGALSASTAMAQETTAAIRGVVVAVDGSPVAEAKVDVLDNRTGVLKTLATDGNGVFLATRLSPGGPYTVIVSDQQTVSVESLAVAEIYNLRIIMDPTTFTEAISVVASRDWVEVATGPSTTFDELQVETAVAFTRDIVEVYGLDPRVNVDNDQGGYAINCAGKHNRFNRVTLDGVGQSDSFGLNSNGYSTAVGMPFPFDAVAQVAVELAPADVTYGGFSACVINAVTKSGTNDFRGNAFWEYTDDSLRGDSIGGTQGDFSTPPFESNKYGATFGGRILADKLHFFAAAEDTESPRFLAHGFAGSGNGVERPWIGEAEFQRIVDISNNLWGYDPGGLGGDGAQEEEKQMVRFDWSVNPQHNAALIYNYYDGFQDRTSDDSSNELEFANHFYVKGAKTETITLKAASQWTDSFSTEFFLSQNSLDDSQVTVGPKDFGDFQINIGFNTVYLGADDSRQANALNTDTDYAKAVAQLLKGRNVFTAGYEMEEISIFNQFVQHSRGGEWDFFDDSGSNPAHCAGLTAQGRHDDPACGTSGIDKFELGRPSTIAYGSGGGTNDPRDAAASFANTLNSIYLQDEIFLDEQNLTLALGLRYEFFTSDDRPNFNPTFAAANGGLRNDGSLDGLSILMPRVGFNWGPRPNLSVRGSIGRFSGGNPNVWISNAWSNDGLTNVQLSLRNNAINSVFDGTLPLTGNQPGRDVPQSLFDQVAAVTPANAVNRGLVLIDPNYEQPSEWKYALGGTYRFDSGYQIDADYLHTELVDSAFYVDLSQSIIGMTRAGAPIYDFTNGQDNLMLTNSEFDAAADILSILVTKRWNFGLDASLGYAYTDGEDISPMTSAVAVSNFENLALSDVNRPRPGTSNYVVPHRFTGRASLGQEYFEGYETRFTVYAVHGEGQPQSFAMGSSDLEGDGFFGRHLLYVPDGPNDPNVVFADSFQTAEFFDWVGRQGLGSGFVDRNETHAAWSTRFDVGVHQDFPIFGGVKGRGFAKIYNFGNFLNDDWGKIYDAPFFTPQVVDSSVDDEGRYVFEDFDEQSVTDLLENATLWQARFGLEIRF